MQKFFDSDKLSRAIFLTYYMKNIVQLYLCSLVQKRGMLSRQGIEQIPT